MIKPSILKKGDKIAIVSLSWGGLGDKKFIHKYYIAKKRLEKDFGLEVITMPNTLKGSEYIYNHPEKRAEDLMNAFKDNSIKAIFSAIGGDDSIRLLPYIDYNIIKNNPKIFLGYSDTTVNHFMMNKAGLVSFYGPSIMSGFGEYVKMLDYTIEAIQNILFKNSENYEIKSSKLWSKDEIDWCEENINKKRKLISEKYGYEVIQGSGVIEGEILGGCIDVFPMIIGTNIWPTLNQWKNKILLLETSEDKMTPNFLLYYLRNLGVQGILNVIKGIIVGKPMDEKYYNEYKEIYIKVLAEFNLKNLPVMYNINIGHSTPIGIIPLGNKVRIDYNNKKITIIESATINKRRIYV